MQRSIQTDQLGNFNVFPNEIIYHILQFMDYKDIKTFAILSSFFNTWFHHEFSTELNDLRIEYSKKNPYEEISIPFSLKKEASAVLQQTPPNRLALACLIRDAKACKKEFDSCYKQVAQGFSSYFTPSNYNPIFFIALDNNDNPQAFFELVYFMRRQLYFSANSPLMCKIFFKHLVHPTNRWLLRAYVKELSYNESNANEFLNLVFNAIKEINWDLNTLEFMCLYNPDFLAPAFGLFKMLYKETLSRPQYLSTVKVLIKIAYYHNKDFLNPLKDKSIDEIDIYNSPLLSLLQEQNPSELMEYANYFDLDNYRDKNNASLVSFMTSPKSPTWLIRVLPPLFKNIKPLLNEINVVDGCFFLHKMAERDTYINKHLLAHGADANIIDAQGNTPLHYLLDFWIAQLSTNSLIFYSLTLNVSTSTRFDTDKIEKELTENITLLLQHQADINAQNQDGLTPLTFLLAQCTPEKYASVYNNGKPFKETIRAILQLLLEHGADPTIPNKAGQTAIDLCAKLNDLSLYLELKQFAKKLHPAKSKKELKADIEDKDQQIKQLQLALQDLQNQTKERNALRKKRLEYFTQRFHKPGQVNLNATPKAEAQTQKNSLEARK
jgi:ankyrin repeat protein